MDNNLKALIRLELKARFGMRGVPRKTLIARFLFAGIFGAGIYTLYILAMNILIGMFRVFRMEYTFLVGFIVIYMLLQFFVNVSTRIRNLYHSGDTALLMRFPVSAKGMYISKMIPQVIFEVACSLLLLLPVLLMWCVERNGSMSYYMRTLMTIIPTALIPSALAGLLTIPTMFISARIKNMHLSTLIGSVVIVSAVFAGYILLFKLVESYLNGADATLVGPQGTAVMNALHYAYPFSLIADWLIGENYAVAVPVILALPVLLVVGDLLVAKKYYMYTLLKDLESDGVSFSLRTKNKVRHPAYSIFRREFLDIFRSTNYSFQYFVMACAAPVMVYFTNDLAIAKASSSELGEATLPTLTLLVLLIFVTISVSFAGSCVSRESNCFYLTKISPVSVVTQVLVKVALYLIVALGSILACVIVVVATGQVDPAIGFSIGGIALLFAIALTCFAVKLDLIKPHFPLGGDGELVNGNFGTFLSMVVGLVLSVLMGLGAILGTGFKRWPMITVLAVLGGIAAALVGGAVTWLLIGLQKNYEQIVQRG